MPVTIFMDILSHDFRYHFNLVLQISHGIHVNIYYSSFTHFSKNVVNYIARYLARHLLQLSKCVECKKLKMTKEHFSLRGRDKMVGYAFR